MKTINSYIHVILISIMIAVIMTSLSAQTNDSPLQQVTTGIVSKITSDADYNWLEGKTLVVMQYKDIDNTSIINTKILQSMLINEFVKTKQFKVAEREQINKAIGELKFDNTGLVMSDQIRELGKSLSAQCMIAGDICTDDNGCTSINTRIVDVETAEIKNAFTIKLGGKGIGNSKNQIVSWNLDDITIASEENNKSVAVNSVVRWLVDENILSKDISELWRPELTKKMFVKPDRYVVRVDTRPDAYYIKLNLNQIMRDLVAVMFGDITPRIAVNTTEVILRRAVPDPAVQTELSAALLRYGFDVIDMNQAKSALAREQLLQLETGDRAAIQATATQLNADIVVKGESFAEEHPNGRGFDARVEFCVVEGATGKVLASISNTDTVRNVESPNVAAKSSLEKAAKNHTLKMCTAMLNAYGEPINRLRVWKIKSYDDRTKIIQGLQKLIPGAVVRAESMDLRATKSAVFTISTKKSVDEIADALKSIKSLNVAITGIECRSIICELK